MKDKLGRGNIVLFCSGNFFKIEILLIFMILQ